MRLSAKLRTCVTMAIAALAAVLTPSPAHAQTDVDQSDPAVIEQELRQRERQRAQDSRTPRLSFEPIPDAMTSLSPVPVGAIRIEGATALAPEDFASAIEPYLGRELSTADLRALASDVAAAARRSGYGLARAWVPPQTLANGILRVHVDEGRIDLVEATGPAAGLVQQRLTRLANGQPVRTAELERQLLLAGDVAGVGIRSARLAQRGGRSVLLVDTSFDAVRGRAALDNWGTDALGPVRLRAGVDLNSMLVSGDRISLSAVVTPLDPSEFQFIHGRYSVPMGASGTEMSIGGYLAHTRAGGGSGSRNLEGRSSEIELGLSHPFFRSRQASLWGNLDLGLRDSRLERLGIPVRDDRIATATGTLYANGRLGGGTARARIAATQGLDVLGATQPGDPLASRRDASGRFTKLTYWAEYERRLAGRLSVQLATEGQLASGPLLASEEMGLGGRYFLRGFDYRELSGDEGAAVSAELRFDLRRLPDPLRNLQMYLYADAGRVTNHRGGRGDGSLASAGGGVRTRLTHRIEASIEVGIPLTDDASSRRPGPRLSFNLGTHF